MTKTSKLPAVESVTNLPVPRTSAPTREQHHHEPAFVEVWQHFAAQWRSHDRGYSPEQLLGHLLSPGEGHE